MFAALDLSLPSTMILRFGAGYKRCYILST